jgi:hypothetical protein
LIQSDAQRRLGPLVRNQSATTSGRRQLITIAGTRTQVKELRCFAPCTSGLRATWTYDQSIQAQHPPQFYRRICAPHGQPCGHFRSPLPATESPYSLNSISSQNNGTFISNTPRGSNPRRQASECHLKRLKCSPLYNEPRPGSERAHTWEEAGICANVVCAGHGLLRRLSALTVSIRRYPCIPRLTVREVEAASARILAQRTGLPPSAELGIRGWSPRRGHSDSIT